MINTLADNPGRQLKLRNKLLLFCLVTVCFGYLLIINAWIVDDAYITFRTIYNSLNGFGLVWNPGERVQAYTHPLWLLLVSLVYFFTREFYFTGIFLSIACVLFTVNLIMFKLTRTNLQPLLGLALLSLSKAFIDYSTSGLENPLTYVLLVIFLVLYLNQRHDLRQLFHLSLITSLALLTRMDNFLLFALPLIYVFYQTRQYNLKKRAVYVLAGFSPFILWEMFSLFYYGFPFPNTAYAKLNTGIETVTLIKLGFKYLEHSWRLDPVTLVVIASGIFLPLARKNLKPCMLSLGLALYLIYIVLIGGDSMSGRFLAAPFLASVILLIKIPFNSHRLHLIVIISILFYVFFSPFNPWKSHPDYGKNIMPIYNIHTIDDTRGGYYQMTGLLRKSPGSHFGIKSGENLRSSGARVFVYPLVGFLGFYAGPGVYIIDVLALADPLLARLPCLSHGWRIGHFTRKLPAGYFETIQSGVNRIHNTGLKYYYTKLINITRGNLFSSERLIDILKMNLGFYNYLIDFNLYKSRISTYQERMLIRAALLLLSAPGQDEYANLINQGNHAAFGDNWKTACEFWERAKTLKPEGVEARANLGVYYERKELSAKALQEYKYAADKIGEPWQKYYEQLKLRLK